MAYLPAGTSPVPRLGGQAQLPGLCTSVGPASAPPWEVQTASQPCSGTELTASSREHLLLPDPDASQVPLSGLLRYGTWWLPWLLKAPELLTPG